MTTRIKISVAWFYGIAMLHTIQKNIVNFKSTFHCPHCQTLLRQWQDRCEYAYPCPACGGQIEPMRPPAPELPSYLRVSSLRKEPTRPISPERLSKLGVTGAVVVRQTAPIRVETRTVQPMVPMQAVRDREVRDEAVGKWEARQARFARIIQIAAAVVIGVSLYLMDPWRPAPREPELVPIYTHPDTLPEGMVGGGPVPVMLIEREEEPARPVAARAAVPARQ